MKNIKFATRRLTIISTNTILNTDYDKPFCELLICFDKKEYNWEFALEGTERVYSDIRIVQNLYDLLKCNGTLEMNGRKIRVLLYKTRTYKGTWVDGWEIAGYGAYNSDMFIILIFEKHIMKRGKLEKICTEINRCW